jgi:hypothetical protein
LLNANLRRDILLASCTKSSGLHPSHPQSLQAPHLQPSLKEPGTDLSLRLRSSMCVLRVACETTQKPELWTVGIAFNIVLVQDPSLLSLLWRCTATLQAAGCDVTKEDEAGHLSLEPLHHRNPTAHKPLASPCRVIRSMDSKMFLCATETSKSCGFHESGNGLMRGLWQCFNLPWWTWWGPRGSGSAGEPRLYVVQKAQCRC